MATAATQQRSQQLGLKSKLAAPFGAKCSVRLKFFHNQKGDLEDRWVEGMYWGLSPTVNDGHVVLRNDGKAMVLRKPSMCVQTSCHQIHPRWSL